MEIDSSCTVVVLTALDREQRAVRALLRNLRSHHHSAGTVFEVGELDGQAGSVVLAEIGAGNQGAAVIAERAIAEFRPRAVLFVGIAGALHDDLDFGTVVVGTKIYGYHGGVDEDSGFRTHPQAWESDHALDQFAREVNRTGSWHPLLPDPTAPPHVVFRAIAAGEVVRNSRQTPLAMQLRESCGDAGAIEMESAGMAKAAHLNRTPFLTIRGISDKADGNKYDADRAGTQQTAAHNAAAFAITVARAIPAPGPGQGAPRAAGLSQHGNAAHGVLDGTVPVPEKNATPSWTLPAEPVEVVWRTELPKPRRGMERSALEVHIVPTGGTGRLEVRTLRRLGDDLATFGRSRGLFSATEQLDANDTDKQAWAESVDHRTGPSGLAVLRTGQRAVWSPLPADSLGAVVDPDDLLEQVTRHLRLLIELDLPDPETVAVALGIEPAVMATEGRVRDLPRSQASGIRMAQHVRVPPDDVISYRALLDDPSDIADELAARLHAVFRQTR